MNNVLCTQVLEPGSQGNYTEVVNHFIEDGGLGCVHPQGHTTAYLVEPPGSLDDQEKAQGEEGNLSWALKNKSVLKRWMFSKRGRCS